MSYSGHSLGESYSSADMQSVYFTAPADWATGQSLGESYPSAEMLSVYFTAQAYWDSPIRNASVGEKENYK